MNIPYAEILEKHKLHLAPANEGVVVIHRAGEKSTHCLGNGDNQFTERSMVEIGCIAKLLTSLALLSCAERKLLQMDDSVSQYFSSASTEPTLHTLADIKIRDLANHAHGLDLGVELHDLVSPQGYIDRNELLRSLKKMAQPTRVFLYGFAGPVIAASILESVTGKPYRQVIEELLGTMGLGDEFSIDEEAIFCPAINQAMGMSPLGLAIILDWIIATKQQSAEIGISQLSQYFRAQEIKLPDHHFGGEYYCLGWFRTDQWLTVNAHGNKSTITLMFDPLRDTYLVVVAKSEKRYISYMITESLLEKLDSSVGKRTQPKNLPVAAETIYPSIEGDYESGRYVCSIKSIKGKSCISVTSRRGSERVLQRTLRHQFGNVFQVFPAGGDFMSMVRFEKCEDGEFLISTHQYFKKVCNDKG